MRYFETLKDAMYEIRRDVYKGPKVTSTRVQQRVDQDIKGRELLGYTYCVDGNGFPTERRQIIALGQELNFELFTKYPGEILDWLISEEIVRVTGSFGTLTERDHPALKTTLEGSWPSYTYGERLYGAMDAMVNALQTTDSRRAFWPIFRPEDALRANSPTRIPCSLGYQALIRQTKEGPELIFYYLQRSADFDTFFLSDVYLAHRFQCQLAEKLGIRVGQFMHTIISLHSFTIEGSEIY